MRTTLDIDDDVLAAAKAIAKVEGKTAGLVISELVRKALTMPTHNLSGLAEEQTGFQTETWATLPGRAGIVVTPEAIERVQDEIDREDATPWDFETSQPRKG